MHWWLGARRGAPEWVGGNETAAGMLGMSVEKLKAERQAGKSLVTIAAGKGIAEDTLIAELLDAGKTTVNELLAAGMISQA